MEDRDHFAGIWAEERMLRSRGLESWPSGRDLATRLFGVEDELEALASALGFEILRDVRGRVVCRRK